MSEQLLTWLIGGMAGLIWVELRGIRTEIKHLSLNNVEHSVRLSSLEKLVSGRPCIDTKCENHHEKT